MNYLMSNFISELVIIDLIKEVKSDIQFYGGTPDDLRLNDMASKYEVSKWFTTEKLNNLIHDLNNGMPFEPAYAK